MKNFINIIISLILLVSVFTATSCSSDKYGKGYTFRQGFDPEYPPFTYLSSDDETYTGFDIELCQAVCDYYGWTYEAVPIVWNDKEATLYFRTVDCLWSGYTIEGSENVCAWSYPYCDYSQVVLVRKASNYLSVSALAGKRVGVQYLSTAYETLKNGDAVSLSDTFSDLKVYDDATIAVDALLTNQVDAVVLDSPAANYYLSQNDSLTLLAEPIGEETYGIGFRLEDTELRDLVNLAITELYNNGTFEKIAANYPDIQEYLCWNVIKL